MIISTIFHIICLSFPIKEIQTISISHTIDNKYENLIKASHSVATSAFHEFAIHVSIQYPKNFTSNETYIGDVINQFISMTNYTWKYEIYDFSHLTITSFPKYLNVFFLDTYIGFRENLLDYFKKGLFDFSGFFVMILVDCNQWNEEDIQLLADDLWEFYIVNVNFVIQNCKVKDEVDAYSFFPYTEGLCEVPNIVKWATYKNDSFPESFDFFPRKLRNIRQCNLTVAIREAFVFLSYNKTNEKLGGIEGIIFNLLSSHICMNFTPIYIQAHQSEEFVTNSISEALDLVYTKKANVSFGFEDVRYDRILTFDYTVPHFMSSFVFLAVPEPSPSPLDYIIMPFEKILWLAIILILFISYAVVRVLEQSMSLQVRNFIIGSNINEPELNIFSILLGNSLHRLPRRTFARTLMMLFILFSFIIRSAYQGSLYEVTQRKGRYIDTLDEMLKNDFQFYSWTGLEYYTDAIKELNEKIIFTSNRTLMYDIADKTQIPGSKSTMISSRFHIPFRNKNDYGYQALIPSKSDINIVSLTFYLQKQSCLTRAFNYYLQGLSSHGHIQYAINQFYDPDFLLKNDSVSVRPMSLNNFIGAFRIYEMGIFISVAVLICEILLHKVNQGIEIMVAAIN